MLTGSGSQAGELGGNARMTKRIHRDWEAQQRRQLLGSEQLHRVERRELSAEQKRRQHFTRGCEPDSLGGLTADGCHHRPLERQPV